jgi:dipeptidase
MCDTLVATPDATADGVMLFAKNSDREPNEAQHVLLVAAADHEPGARVRCTYIEIPQVAHTHAVMLSKPFWMWGAEMGVNEHGVAIGNEAIFSKVAANQQPALLGMDLLRLGLERAASAEAALQVITSLLEQYGQGGNAGFTHSLYYHNSFLIADPQEAWVLETVDRHWAAKKVHGVYSISNCLTLGNDFDRFSPELVSFAVGKGWCKGREDFDFAACYSDFLYTRFSDSRNRCDRSGGLLHEQRGQLDVAAMMAALRDHGAAAGADWRPDDGLTGAQVCMHVGFGPVRVSQSVGSQVSHLHPQLPTHFFTGTSAPCTSLFKPAWFDAPWPEETPPTGVYDPGTLFWRHERLHRQTLRDYAARIARYAPQRDELEANWTIQALQKDVQPTSERATFVRACFEQGNVAEDAWLNSILGVMPSRRPGRLHATAWKQFDRQAQMPG